MSSILRSSKFVRYFIGLTRNIVISNRQDVDNSLLQRSQHLACGFSSNLSSNPLSLQGGSSLDRTVRRLDENARHTGRIPFKDIEDALSEIRLIKNVTTSQSLMVIRCCGNLVPEEAPEHRTQLVNEIWNTLQKLGVPMDISHYNALLKVYLENEHKFSPTEFLAKLESQGVEPNRVTYQRLIAGYCQIGDITGATKILEFMKEKQLPVSEGVFNALIFGHSQANDMQSAEGMLNVMRQANLEPSNETYTILLCGYARRGDQAALDRLIIDCKVKDIMLSDKDFLEVAYTAGVNGHDQLVDEILKNIRKMVGYNQDAANVLIRLITKGKDESAYKVFLTLSAPNKADDTSPNMSGHVFIKQLVKANRSAENIVAMSERLAKDGHTKHGVWLAVESSFLIGKPDLTIALMKVLEQQGLPIRNHYFWPLLVTQGKASNINGMIDILRKMVLEFNIFPNSETVKEYYLPYAGSKTPEENLRLLMDAGVRRGQAVVALISYLIMQNKLKDAVNIALQYPGLNLQGGLVTRYLMDALQQTKDVKSAVALVHIMTTNGGRAEEEEDGMPSEEAPGRFLSNVVVNPQTRELTEQILKEMLERGLAISNSCAELVESRLQGKQLTTEISDLLSKLSAGDLSPATLKRPASSNKISTTARNPKALEFIREKMKANNESEEKLISITRSIFQAYCFNEDLENALKTKKEFEEELKQEVSPGMWALLLDLYCSKENLEGAKECLDNIKKSSGTFELDGAKILKMTKVYIQKNQFDEALTLLKDVKPREDKGYQVRAAAWQVLTTTADVTKDPERVKTLFETLKEAHYVEPANIFLGPIIKAYLIRDDVEGALKEFERCVQLYRATPWKNEITTRLIEKEDAVNLQTLVDLSTQVHGEINSLYDLVLSFVECGRIRQARKILETPGLNSRNNRLHIACERYKKEGHAAPLEGLVEATKDIHHIDRSEIYYNLLETYCQADNPDKALALWTQMQDEDVNVSNEFLIKLGVYLKEKGYQIPFEIPKTSESEKIQPPQIKDGQRNKSASLSVAIRTKDVDEALKIKESLEKDGKRLSRSEITQIMELLIEKNRLTEATNILIALQKDTLPPVRTLNFLIKRLMESGQIDAMEQVGKVLTEELKKTTSFINRFLSCAVAAGKEKDELDKLEKQIDSATSSDEIDELVNVFPLGGIFAVLESSPSHLEQVTRIVDKYYNKGATGPANCLCMFHLGQGQFDKARELYQHYNLSNSSRIMFQSVLSKARIEQNPKLVEELIVLLKDAPSINTEAKALLHSNLINSYLRLNDASTALAKLEEALQTIPLEVFHTSTLKRLKEALEANNIQFKYTIPPKKTKESSSSSSSSSELETKSSMAAKH